MFAGPTQQLPCALRQPNSHVLLGCPSAAGINEQQLFHGTSAAAAAAITKGGFDCRLNSAGVYGQGTYFSNCSYTAVVYSNIKGAATVGTLTLLAARVLLGRQCEGKYGMRRPPEGFDSVFDKPQDSSSSKGRYLVIFDNSSAYPEYVITVTE